MNEQIIHRDTITNRLEITHEGRVRSQRKECQKIRRLTAGKIESVTK